MRFNELRFILGLCPSLSEIEFDEAFLFGNYSTALPRDIAQALLRVRVLKENRLTYTLSTPEYYNEEAGLNKITKLVHTKEECVVKTHPLAKWVLAPEWVRWNHIYNENEEKISRKEYRRVVEQYLTDSGYVLRSEIHDVDVPTRENDEDDNDVSSWDNIPDLSHSEAERIYYLIKKGDASATEKIAYRKYEFRSQFVADCEESFMKDRWDTFILMDCMGCFWNVVAEKRWNIHELASAEARKRYAMMSSDRIKKRHAMDRFLTILGMNYSLEMVTISPEKLAEIGPVLEKEEKMLREELGLRPSQRKSAEWKTSHSIDLIRVILDSWCCGRVYSNVTQIRQNKKRTQQYTLTLNNDDTLWDKIKVHNIDDSKLLIKF